MKRLTGLDALRGVAALMVVVYHSGNFTRVPFSGRWYLAVDFFFVLSGYVMARTYEARFAEGLTAPAFVSMRFRRFFPLMAVGVALGVVVTWGNWPAWQTALLVVMGLLTLPWIGAELPYPLNPPGWSIFAELAANFCHAVILHRLRVWQLLALSAVAIGIQVYLNPQLGDIPSLGLLRVMQAYPVGIALGRVVHDRPALPWWLGITLLPIWPLAAALAGWGYWADIAFLYLVCPAAVLAGLSAQRVNLAWLGAISFPLYAVHFPVLLAARAMGVPLFIDVIPCIAAAWAVVWLGDIGRSLKRSGLQVAGA